MITPSEISLAVKQLRQGNLVAFPTETVYGLGADAKNENAIKKIFALKQRPINHPIIVHIGDGTQLSDWTHQTSPTIDKLIAAFWPGPLTIIFKKAPHVSDLITGSQDTIGVRMPSHPIALALLQAFHSGLAAPSANRFGRISPTTAEAVRDEFGDDLMILDGGACQVGLESTILDMSTDTPKLLRPGMITASAIEAVINVPVKTNGSHSIRVSGSHKSHYAPSTPTHLVNTQEILKLEKPGKNVLLTYHEHVKSHENLDVIILSADPKIYAHDLYDTLRRVDKNNYQSILIEDVPSEEAWQAIRDRLNRAST